MIKEGKKQHNENVVDMDVVSSHMSNYLNRGKNKLRFNSIQSIVGSQKSTSTLKIYAPNMMYMNEIPIKTDKPQ